jgi:hypothetical protein
MLIIVLSLTRSTKRGLTVHSLEAAGRVWRVSAPNEAEEGTGIGFFLSNQQELSHAKRTRTIHAHWRAKSPGRC